MRLISKAQRIKKCRGKAENSPQIDNSPSDKPENYPPSSSLVFALFGGFSVDILGWFGFLQYLLLANIGHTFTNDIFLRDKDHCNFCVENVMT